MTPNIFENFSVLPEITQAYFIILQINLGNLENFMPLSFFKVELAITSTNKCLNMQSGIFVKLLHCEPGIDGQQVGFSAE